MKNLVMAILPLAMGLFFVGCTNDCNTNTKETIKETIKETNVKESVVLAIDSRDNSLAVTSTTTTSTASSQTTADCADCLQVHKLFAEIQTRRDSSMTATQQLVQEMNELGLNPPCMVINGTISYRCGPYSGKDSGNLVSLKQENYPIVDGDF